MHGNGVTLRVLGQWRVIPHRVPPTHSLPLSGLSSVRVLRLLCFHASVMASCTGRKTRKEGDRTVLLVYIDGNGASRVSLSPFPDISHNGGCDSSVLTSFGAYNLLSVANSFGSGPRHQDVLFVWTHSFASARPSTLVSQHRSGLVAGQGPGSKKLNLVRIIICLVLHAQSWTLLHPRRPPDKRLAPLTSTWTWEQSNLASATASSTRQR